VRVGVKRVGPARYLSPRELGPLGSPPRAARLTINVPYLARGHTGAAHGLRNNYELTDALIWGDARDRPRTPPIDLMARG